MKLNHIFWWVAGVDRDKMEKCPSDQKRIGAIGMVILLTSFVAFIAGTAAAMFFTQKGDATSGKLGWSLAFGVLWMLIIFVIDRSLVVTMKKDPTRKNQFPVVIGPFLFRMVLAGIIALMISIPLELFIFSDFIENNRIDFELIERDRTRTQNESTMGKQNVIDERGRQEIQLSKDSVEYSMIKNEIDSLEKEKRKCSSQISFLQQQKNKNTRQINQLKSDPFNSNPGQISNLMKDNNVKQKQIGIIKEKKEDINRKIKEKNAPFSKAEQQLADDQENIKKTTAQIAEIDSVSRELQNRKQTIQDGSGHFFRDYQILNNMISQRDADTGNLQYPTELLFFWLIRIIFFLIELLPTLVKVITPVGAYDRLAYDEENSLKDYFKSDEYRDTVVKLQQNMAQHEIDMQQEQLKIDQMTKIEILKKISLAQQEVADNALRHWVDHINNKVATEEIDTDEDAFISMA